jgi:LacI family transcriptional regulator
MRAIDNFGNLHVEGIIASVSQNTTDYSHFEKVSKMGIPLVFFGRTCLPDLFSSVTANGDVAAKKATQHLIETGSRRIAFLGGPNHLDMVKRRKHGYLEALRDNRIPIDRELVVCNRIDFDLVVEATKQLLQIENRPDAILAVNDTVTFAAFTAIKEMGLRIPEEVALIGFTVGDLSVVRYVIPCDGALRAADNAIFTNNILKTVDKELKIINNNYYGSDDRALPGSECDNRAPMRFLGFIHSHPTQSELQYSTGDEAIHYRMLKRYGSYFGVLVNPADATIGAYYGKELRQARLIIPEP